MAAPRREAFRGAIERVLNSWTVLKLAVSHGFGGADSQAKADWMVYAIDQWFSENSNIETFELEDFLEDVLNTEFDTIADDGSLSQISRLICGFYRLCQSGDEGKMAEELSKLPPCNVQQCQNVQPANSAEGGDSIEEVSDQDTPPPLPDPPCMSQKEETESMETEAVEDDGWMTVSKKGKRR